jgi:transcriptional regulator of arginine metabolism
MLKMYLTMKEHPMSARNDRLKTVHRLLRENRVESQEELLVLLEANGIFVTQATLSRDLKVLKASKMGTGSNGYFYAVPSDDELQRREEIYAQDFIRGYVSIDWNDTLAVVKTYSGLSAPVALAIDNLRLSGVLGTVAGQDNTVFVALRRGYSGDALINDLKARIPDFDEA